MQKFQSNGPFMADMLRVDFINHSVHAHDKESLIYEMVNLVEKTGLLLDRNALWESLLARECDDSTAYNGCALLHPRVPKPEFVSSSFIALGRSPHAIEFSALDGLDADIFFAICCQDSITHRSVLDRLTGMILKTPLLIQLRKAPDSRGMFQSVIACEREFVKC